MATIFLAEPDANPVRAYENGVIVVRLHEFLGPARASLSTAADVDSVCGTVVRDEQTVSYSGSGTSSTISGSSAADTIRIVVSALGLDPNFEYLPYIGLKSEGEVEAGRCNGTTTFLAIGNNQALVQFGRRDAALTFYSSLTGVAHAPNPVTYPGYKLLRGNARLSLPTWANTSELLVIRALTGAGGTFAWTLDVMYLVPQQAQNSSNPTNPYADIDFRTDVLGDLDPLLDGDTFDMFEDRDESTVSWAGQYSVHPGAHSAFGDGLFGPLMDVQEGEDERTIYDAHNDLLFTGNFDDAGIISDIALAAGIHHCESHVVDTDDFSRSIGPGLGLFLGETAQKRIYTITNDHPFQAAGSGAGWQVNGSALVAGEGKYDTPFGGGGTFAIPDPPYGSVADVAAVVLGQTAFESGTGSSSDGHPIIPDLYHCVIECAVTTDHLLAAGFQMLTGFANSDGTDFIGVALDIPEGTFTGSTNFWTADPSTELRASLLYIETPYGSTRLTEFHVAGGGYTTLTSSFAPNDLVRLKIERLWYRFRAKAWLAGDDEPDDWMWDVFMPDQVGATLYEYPWHTHPSIAITDRVGHPQYPTFQARWFAPVEDTAGNTLVFSANPVRLTSVFWSDLSLGYEAYGETPDDMHFHLESFDGLTDHGEVVITPASQRLIIAPWDSYISHPHGWAAYAWKEEGAPDTQRAVLMSAIEKIRRGGFRPHIYRRILG